MLFIVEHTSKVMSLSTSAQLNTVAWVVLHITINGVNHTVGGYTVATAKLMVTYVQQNTDPFVKHNLYGLALFIDEQDWPYDENTMVCLQDHPW